MRWMKLHKVSSRGEADRYARGMGWSDDKDFSRSTGNSLEGYWVDVQWSKSPPRDAEESTITPIAVVVHNRLFPETAVGLVKGKNAWVTEEVFEGLF